MSTIKHNKIITFTKETQYTFKESTFIASEDWQLNTATMALTSPENDFTLYFVQMDASKEMSLTDAQALAEKAWKSVYPDFNLAVERQV